MTATEMEDILKNLDLRVGRIEQILPTLATKDDLKALATKDDLRACATKDDLRACATKDDLEACATKDDLEAYATKEDLKATREDLKRHMSVLFEKNQSELETIAAHVADISMRLPPRM